MWNKGIFFDDRWDCDPTSWCEANLGPLKSLWRTPRKRSGPQEFFWPEMTPIEMMMTWRLWKWVCHVSSTFILGFLGAHNVLVKCSIHEASGLVAVGENRQNLRMCAVQPITWSRCWDGLLQFSAWWFTWTSFTGKLLKLEFVQFHDFCESISPAIWFLRSIVYRSIVDIIRYTTTTYQQNGHLM